MKHYTVKEKSILSGCMDVENYNSLIYAIQKPSQFKGGRLCVLDENLNILETVDGIGNARQIEILNGIAVITARSNGIWIFDVNNVKPKLLANYQTVELATGVSMYANLVFVSCRQYGVEIVDITNPQKPEFKGLIRVGEVQSTCVYNNVLYCGLWGDMAVKAVDITDINNPKELFKVDLIGRGDGVIVKDNYLYALSGQHGRNIKNYADKNDADFGMGNGINIFDISDIKNPQKVFEQNFGKGYSIEFDMWEPVLCGDMVVCGDSIMGIHAYDSKSFDDLFNINFAEFDGVPDAVTGLTATKNALYVATSIGGIYKFEIENIGERYIHNTDKKIDVLKSNVKYSADKKIKIKSIYNTNAPVIAVSENDNYFILACGKEGIHIVSKETGECVFKAKKDGFCCDVKAHGQFVYGAFSRGGMWVFELSETGLNEVCNFTKKKDIQQLCLSKNGKYLACCLESTEVIMLDITDNNNVTEIFSRKAAQGPLYGENFTTNLLDDGTMLMFWHRDGLVYSNPENNDRDFKDIFYKKRNGFMGFGPENGCDTDGKNIFFNLNGGYVLLPFDDKTDVDDLKRYKTPVSLDGKFTVKNNIIIAAERSKGIIIITDISCLEKPEHIAKIQISSICSKPIMIDNKIYIPAWYDGLIQLEL